MYVVYYCIGLVDSVVLVSMFVFSRLVPARNPRSLPVFWDTDQYIMLSSLVSLLAVVAIADEAELFKVWITCEEMLVKTPSHTV